MNTASTVPVIHVSRDEAIELLEAVRKCTLAAGGQTLEREIGVAVSFDSEFLPFLCLQFGRVSQEDRVYLPSNVFLLRKIADILTNESFRRGAKGVAGGRVYISRDGVKRIDVSGDIQVVCTWDWRSCSCTPVSLAISIG